MSFTFRGGLHIPSNKRTADIPIQIMPPPERVSIPMSQHIGAPAIPCVKVGDTVLAGQVIGSAAEGLSCPVHASISGVVEAIEQRNSYIGQGKNTFIVIKNNGENAFSDEIRPFAKSIEQTSPEEIIAVIKASGISGMGGASFPTYAKIQSSLGKVQDLIINCAECEPYITANHRLILEETMAVLDGAQILLKAFDLSTATFAIEDNKLDAAEKLSQNMDAARFHISILKTKYPQGDERQLIYALKKVQIPAGKLPSDVGCVIFNAETCASIYYAFAKGMPLINRIVTVDGDCVAEPKNLRIPIGTSFREVIEASGGLTDEAEKIISGGPMMGNTQWDTNSVVMKGTSSILIFKKQKKLGKETTPTCLHCGKCVGVCPMQLMPNYLSMFSAADKLDLCEEQHITSCVECGSCSYICPGRVPIVQQIRAAKQKITEEKKKKAIQKAQNEGKGKA